MTQKHLNLSFLTLFYRRYFCDRGYKCTVSFNKINNEYYKLYVALQFDSEKMARDVYNK